MLAWEKLGEWLNANVFRPPIVFAVIVLPIGGLLLYAQEQVESRHMTPDAEAEQWLSRTNIRYDNVWCEPTQHASIVHCVASVGNPTQKVYALACASKYADWTGCRLESEK